MAKLDFPDPSQSPYEENGYVYEWDGSKWNIVATPGSGVNLTLQDVTDNGNTTTNGATFGGDVQAARLTAEGTTLPLTANRTGGNNNDMIMRAIGTAGTQSLFAVFNNGDVCVGDGSQNLGNTASRNIALNGGDGSATFGGNIEAAGLTDGSTTKTMTEVLAGGGGDLTLQDVTDNGNTTTNGATFAGNNIQVRCQYSSTRGLSLYGGNASGQTPAITFDEELRFFDNGAGKGDRLTINADGSSTFTNTGLFGTWANNGDNAIRIDPVGNANTGSVIVKGDGSAADIAFGVYKGGWSGANNTVARINASGSAEFAGTVQAGGNANSGGGRGTQILSSGSVYVTNTGAASVFQAWQESDSTAKLTLRANGSALFTGLLEGSDDVRAGGNPNSGIATGAQLVSNGRLVASNTGTNPVYQGFTTSASAATSQINADGSASFTGKVGIGTAVNTTYNLQIVGNSSGNQFALGDSSPRFILDYKTPSSTTVCPQITSDGEGLYYYGRGSTVTSTHYFHAGSTNTEKVRIDGDGLKFNGDTSSLNALNDYEEGTWTPTLQTPGSGTQGTVGSTNWGGYVKIGQQVTLTFNLEVDQINDSVSYQIWGFPFVVLHNPTIRGIGTGACYAIGGASLTNVGSMVVTCVDNSSSGAIRGNNTSGQYVDNWNILQNGTQLRGAVTYFTA